MITEFFYKGPIGLLYYSGSGWIFLAVVVFLGLLLVVITRINRSKLRRSRRQKWPQRQRE